MDPRSESEWSHRAKVIYITYDGVLEPIGDSQVLGYLRRLAGLHRIWLLSFEKAGDWGVTQRRQLLHQELAKLGIRWTALRYHKSPTVPATCFDVCQGAVVALALALRHGIGIVHARSYVPALIALPLKVIGLRFVFDMRGFWPDEKVEGGAWPAGSRIYLLAKRLERVFLSRADVVVSLTRRAVEVMRGWPWMRERRIRFEVIPTCADLDRFRPEPRARPRSAEEPFVLGMVGSVGLWYKLDDMLDCFHLLRQSRPQARLLVINRDAHGLIRQRLAAAGIPETAVEIREVPHEEVPGVMARMDAGILLLDPCWSKQASSPTKVGEFLGCGVPILVNSGIGDMDELFAADRIGAVMRDFSEAEKRRALGELLALCASDGVRERCVEAAQRRYSLDDGVRAYDGIYRGLLGPE